MTTQSRPRAQRILIPVVVVVLTVALAAVRMVFTPGFYFADDTQLGSIGQWYELGDRLLRGEIPILAPQAWQAGNYFAEGQWGLINPVTWLIAIVTRIVPDALLVASTVKVAFLGLMALGTYFLAHAYGASPLWAGLAGVLAPLAGFTAYMDAPSWVTGLMTSAIFAWVWWTYLRVVDGRSPWPFFIASYLLISVGYVFGVIVLVFLFAESLARNGIRHRWLEFRRGLLASVWAGLWTIVVYLPGLLTAPVTKRGAFYVVNGEFLNADLSDFGAASTPTASATIGAWFGPATAAPLAYIAWILPLVPLFAPLLKSSWRGLFAPAILGGAMFLIVIGPSDIGPLRWPIRFMPYLVIAVVVIVAVLATRGYPAGVTRRSVLAAFITAIALNWLTWAVTPQSWRSIAVCFAVQALAILLLAVLARPRTGWSRRMAAIPTAVGAIVIVTGALVLPQMRVFPYTPLPTFAVPTDTSTMMVVLDDSSGDVMTVGDATAGSMDAASYDERLIANLWYISPADVSNLYTVLPFSTFSDDLCMDLKGNTCDKALSRLLSVDTETGERVADLLGISEILGYTPTFPAPSTSLPEGWHVADEGEATWRIARDTEVAPAGGVTWTGAGTRVQTVAQSETSVTLRVEDVGSDPRVTLSRLAWPGYQIDGAAQADPVRGYLLTVDVGSAAVGDVITLTFRPPGFAVEVAAAILAGLLLIVWPIIRLRAGRTRGTRASAAPAVPKAD